MSLLFVTDARFVTDVVILISDLLMRICRNTFEIWLLVLIVAIRNIIFSTPVSFWLEPVEERGRFGSWSSPPPPPPNPIPDEPGPKAALELPPEVEPPDEPPVAESAFLFRPSDPPVSVLSSASI
jgi:hypothetical protein